MTYMSVSMFLNTAYSLSIPSAAKNIVYIIFITTANILDSYSKLGR